MEDLRDAARRLDRLISGRPEATVKAYLQTIIPPQICKITDVSADGNQIIYTASCIGGAVKTVKTVTTSYHGDRSEGTNSTGSKTEAKLVGACK